MHMRPIALAFVLDEFCQIVGSWALQGNIDVLHEVECLFLWCCAMEVKCCWADRNVEAVHRP